MKSKLKRVKWALDTAVDTILLVIIVAMVLVGRLSMLWQSKEG